MPYIDFWEIVLDPLFLMTVGLVALPFLVTFYSMWVTWEENEDVMKKRKSK
jgi:hypothetical protein